MDELTEELDKLIYCQIRDWELARKNYGALANVKTRDLYIGDFRVTVQFNPERIRSSAARTDAAFLQNRSCFFCNVPEEQKSMTRNDFDIRVNPYPISEKHLTIPVRWHEKQNIKPYYEDMLWLENDLENYVVFYNGPKCGASAPDHLHFQAVLSEDLPIVSNYERAEKRLVWSGEYSTLYALSNFISSAFVLVSSHAYESIRIFNHLYDQLDIKDGEYEPMMNVAIWQKDYQWFTCIFPRKELRPSCFYAEGDDRILISPATVEMAGLFITPREEDFEKVTSDDLANILQEVSVTKEDMDRIIAKFLKNL